MPPTLDDLGSRGVIAGTPDGADLIPYHDVSEVGNSQIKKATLVIATQAALAADPQGGREALELDDGNGYIPSNGVVLSDLSNAIAPSGTLARQGARLAVHDGATTGGIASRRFTGLKILGGSVTRPSGVNSDLVFEVFRTRITAAEYGLNKAIVVSGVTTLESPGADCAVFASVVPEESSGVFANGVLQTLRTGITFERRVWSKRYVIDSSGGLVPPDGGTYVDGPSIAVTREGIEGADQSTVAADGTNGIEQDIVFELHTSTTGAGVSTIYFSYDLEVSVAALV